MTSLSNQLSRLQDSQANQRTLDKNSAFSLLFDFKTAASFPIDTIYSLAYSGFQSLLKLDPSFSIFTDRFFPSSVYNKAFIRENLLENENNELHKELQDFILKLAGYFRREDAKKILELLIKVYEIHRYEAEDIIVGYMNYHKTTEYMKLLQNINLAQKEQWAFLETIVKTGENKLERKAIMRKIEDNPSLLEIFVKMDLRIWNLTKNSENSLFSIKEKRMKSADYIENQGFHRFLVALMFDCLKVSRKLRENQVFINILLNYIADLVKSKETVISGIMIFIEIIEKNVNINKKIIEAFIKECLEKGINEENIENIEKIFNFLIYLSQRIVVSEKIHPELMNFIEKNMRFFIEFVRKSPYDLKKLFLLIFKETIKDLNEKNLEVLFEMLDKIKKKSFSNEINSSFYNEILEIFLDKLLENKNIDFSLEIYRKVLHSSLSSEFSQLLYRRINVSEAENKEFLMKFMNSLNEEGLLPLETVCFDYKHESFSINIGLFSENHELRMKSIEKLQHFIKKNTEKLTMNLEKILLIALKNDKTLDFLEKVLEVLLINIEVLEKNLEDVLEFLEVFLEILRNPMKKPLKSKDFYRNLAFFCESIAKVANPSLMFSIIAKTQEFSSFFDKTLDYFSETYEAFNYDSTKKGLDLFHRISPFKPELFSKFLDKIIDFDIETAISLLINSNNKLDVRLKLDFLIKNKKKLAKIDKKPIFSHLIFSIANSDNFEEKSAVYNLILSDSEPWTISFLNNSNEDLKFIVNLLIIQLENPIETELKTMKVLIFLNKKLREKDAYFAENPEFFLILMINFILTVKMQIGFETRRIWLETLENARKIYKKDNRLIEFKAFQGLFKKIHYELKDFHMKILRKIVKNILKIRVLIVQNGDNIEKMKDWTLFEKIFEFLTGNFNDFTEKTIALSLLESISKREEGNYCQNKEFLENLKSRSKENEDFYRYFLRIMMKFGDFNNNFAEILEFSNELILEKPRFIEIFIEILNNSQSSNDFFSILSEANQSLLLESLIKFKEQAKIYIFLDKIQPEPSLISSLISKFTNSLDFQSIYALFLLISRQNLISIDIYRETQGFLAKLIEKPHNYTQKSALFTLIFRILKENLKTILQNKTILFDFQRKLNPKDYQVHIEDLMGTYTEKKVYKNLDLAIKVLKENLSYRGNLERFSLTYEILDFIAIFSLISFKTVSKTLEKVFIGMKIENIEEIENIDEILGFFVKKLLEENQKNSRKIAQFLIISMKVLIKKIKIHRNYKEIIEKDIEKNLKIYGNENLDSMIIIFLSLVGKEKTLENKEIIEFFASFITKSSGIKELLASCDQGLAFLKLFLEKKGSFINNEKKTLRKNSLEEKSLEFLLRKLFKKSRNSSNFYIFQAFLAFLQFLLKSKPFHRLLSQNLKKIHNFQEEFASFFSRLFILDQFLNKTLKTSAISKKKLSFLANKKSLKRVSNLLNEILDFLHGLLPIDVILTIIAIVMSSNNQNLEFKASVLKGLRLRVLHNSEISRKVSISAKETLITEILKGLFEEKNIEKYLKEKKSLNFLRISLILATELIGETGLLSFQQIEINLDQSLLLLDTEKLDIVGLNLVFLSRLASKNSKFLEEIIRNLDKIMIKTLEMIIIPSENQSHRDLAIAALSSFIRNLDILLNPYIENIEASLFRLNSEKTIEVLLLLATTIPAKNLLKPLFKLCEDLSSFDLNKITVFLCKILETIDSADFQDLAPEIQKTLLKLLDFSRVFFIDKESGLDWSFLQALENGVCDCYGEFSTKCNEVQMKKFLLQVVNWSEKKLDIETVGFKFPYYKKIVFYRLGLKVFDRLGSFFVGFFSYFFESTMGLIGEISEVFKEKGKKSIVLGKRKRELPEEYYNLYSGLLLLIVENLNRLFRLDKEEFIDNQKYEKLLENIPLLFELNKIPDFTQESADQAEVKN